ncbi:hypothetical protein TGAM01_v209137 [Trichoderma gamsii]|uniref:Uncharacterized protein n=1 Tax=Trichoderma gamsii TaxID=398673 RepID=A0A0W7VZK2_9HYPO|nr:hypothetical protein TGAM01_v209137 [Trichoderma gamsii]PNP45270.1 hypothetical protein TGAMA5MH_02993 [Trichoderma gamsii]PON22067.1 hypothetical protein TGAM01_v209137 [Trichoderma gamsii]
MQYEAGVYTTLIAQANCKLSSSLPSPTTFIIHHDEYHLPSEENDVLSAIAGMGYLYFAFCMDCLVGLLLLLAIPRVIAMFVARCREKRQEHRDAHRRTWETEKSRSLPVTNTPTHHSTGDIRRDDEETAKILALTKIRSKLPKKVSQRAQEVIE